MAANPLPRRARIAVTAVFFVNGAVFSSLFARLPAIKADLGLTDRELGAALLVATLGLLGAQVVAGALAVRYGSRAVMRGAAPVYCAAVALPALAPTGEAFALALLVLGGANGALDVATRGLLAPEPRDRRRAATLLARPSRRLAALGALGFCVLLAEGSVADWSAIYLRESVGSSQAVAAVFPLVVSAAASRPDVAAGPAIAAVSTTGYAGFMAGPPLIGLLAELGTLRAALLLPVLLCLTAAVLAPAVRRLPLRAGAG